jgi:hypothetical protein
LVKKILNEKIPKEKRKELCFLCDEYGPILIEKIGIADRVKPDSSTQKLLKILIYEKEELKF